MPSLAQASSSMPSGNYSANGINFTFDANTGQVLANGHDISPNDGSAQAWNQIRAQYGMSPMNVAPGQSVSGAKASYDTRIIWQSPDGRIQSGLPDGSDPKDFNTMADLQAYMKSRGESGYVQTQTAQQALQIVQSYTGNKDYQGYTGSDYQAPTPQQGSPAQAGTGFSQWFGQQQGQPSNNQTPNGHIPGTNDMSGAIPGPTVDNGAAPSNPTGNQTLNQAAQGLGPLLQPFNAPFTGQSVQQTNPYPYAYVPSMIADGYQAAAYGKDFTPPTAQSVMDEPGYKFGMDEGIKAIQRSAAAMGTALNPDTVKALEEFGTNYAGTKYDNAFGRTKSTYDTNLNTFMGNQSLRQAAFGNNLNIFDTNNAVSKDAFTTNLGVSQYNNSLQQQNYNNAQQEYLNNYNIYSQNQNNIFNKLSAEAGTGQTAAATLGQQGSYTGNQVGNVTLGAAQTIGANTVGAAGALGTGAYDAFGATSKGLSNINGTFQGLQIKPYGT